MESRLRIALIYPDLLGTYGDKGNALVLAHRARARGITAEVIEVDARSPIPESCDIYLLGGGEDAAQVAAAEGLRLAKATIQRSIEAGSAIFAVCAGFQLLGNTYAAADGSQLQGIELLDMATTAGSDRIIGEVVIEASSTTGLPLLTGFENHAGRTLLGPDETPLGRVIVGRGNGNGVDGVLRNGIIGTYLHGPALARNPALADYLISYTTRMTLEPLIDDLVEQYREERLAFASLTGRDLKRATRRLHRG
jgi:CobQ-like glutamine amidotransferase family enzyme